MMLINKINNLEKEINTKNDELHQLRLKFQNLQNKFEKKYYHYRTGYVEKLVYIQNVNNYEDKYVHVTGISITLDISCQLVITLGDAGYCENNLTLITEKEFIEKYNNWKIQFQSIFDKILPNNKTIINI